MISETQDTQNAVTVIKDQLPANIDGWDAAAADSANKPMRGSSIKFDSGSYFIGKEKTLVKPDKRFVAMDLRQGWMFLKKDTPAEYVMRPIDGPKPPRPDSFADENEWPDALDGKPADPWKYTRFLYLLDPLTAETFTFTSSTWGGLRGIDDLTQQIKLMRTTEPGAVPIIELQSAPWSTKFGIKQRPCFKVVGWHIKTTEAPKLLPDDNKDGGGDDGGVPGTKVVDDLNDEIPW
jgi:hypothetical protein